jgi:hypothetical protein
VRGNLSEAEYWRDLDLVAIDVELAIRVFYGYLAIDLALAEPGVANTLNKELLFWNTYIRSLETTLFVTLARVFDSSAHSIQKVLKAAIEHPEIFSRERLAVRKKGHLPDILIPEFVATSWIQEDDPELLTDLEKELTGQVQQFARVYREIRNKVIAHRVLKEPNAITKLFAKTNKSEIENILNFLFQLTTALKSLFMNGRKPELSSAELWLKKQRVQESTRNVLKALSTKSANSSQF